MIKIPHADSYRAVLQKHDIVVDADKRLEDIRAQVVAQAANVDGTARIRDAVIEEVAHLVERPTAFLCAFDKRFIELPVEVIVSTMEKHVRCFSVFDARREILPYFIGVRNGGSEHLDTVRHGYERLIGARFSDAAFFIERDSEKSLKLSVKTSRS